MMTSRDKLILKWIEDYRAISIKQACTMFFNNSYESTRRRLKQLEDNKILKSTKSLVLNCKYYYTDKPISEHDLLCIEYLKVLKDNGADILKFKTQPQYLNGKIRPDAFAVFKKDKYIYFTLLEVDLNHFTSNSKFQTYEQLCKSGELQQKCSGQFPSIVVARPSSNIRYNSTNFNTVFTDLSYSNLPSLLF